MAFYLESKGLLLVPKKLYCTYSKKYDSILVHNCKVVQYVMFYILVYWCPDGY